MDYQMVVVVDPKLEEKKAQESLTTLLEKEGFTVSGHSWWGKKDLAYPLRKQTQGLYGSFDISGTVDSNQLYSKFKQDETILRVLVLKQEEGRRISK